ncbi:MAG: hypothetical protein Q9227_002225 [Pyrenula ochraceoflavens]
MPAEIRQMVYELLLIPELSGPDSIFDCEYGRVRHTLKRPVAPLVVKGNRPSWRYQSQLLHYELWHLEDGIENTLFKLSIPILRVCRQIYIEATPVLYGKNVLEIQAARTGNVDKPQKILQGIPKVYFGTVQFLNLDINIAKQSYFDTESPDYGSDFVHYLRGSSFSAHMIGRCLKMLRRLRRVDGIQILFDPNAVTAKLAMREVASDLLDGNCHLLNKVAWDRDGYAKALPRGIESLMLILPPILYQQFSVLAQGEDIGPRFREFDYQSGNNENKTPV